MEGKRDLGILKASWDSWRECLIGEDQNSIFKQIFLVNWNYAIFNLINESRRIQAEKNPDNPLINAPINFFIDRIFFDSQSASIRRLIDKSAYGLLGEKGIFSLIALINDIKQKHEDLTREKYFELRNLQYDNREIKKKEKEFFRTQALKGVSAFFVPEEYNWESSEESHLLFDKLSGKSKEDRNPNDIIQNKTYDLLIEKLNICESISIYANKYIAHSATPDSRKAANADELIITLNHFIEAQKTIFLVSEWLAIFLFGEGHLVLPFENPDLYYYLDVPMISNDDDLERLRNKFNEYRKITEEWNQMSSGLLN